MREKFDLAFFDMCNPRHMCSVIIHDRKIFCAIFGLVQLKFHFLTSVSVRLFVEFLIGIQYMTNVTAHKRAVCIKMHKVIYMSIAHKYRCSSLVKTEAII